MKRDRFIPSLTSPCRQPNYTHIVASVLQSKEGVNVRLFMPCAKGIVMLCRGDCTHLSQCFLSERSGTSSRCDNCCAPFSISLYVVTLTSEYPRRLWSNRRRLHCWDLSLRAQSGGGSPWINRRGDFRGETNCRRSRAGGHRLYHHLQLRQSRWYSTYGTVRCMPYTHTLARTDTFGEPRRGAEHVKTGL